MARIRTIKPGFWKHEALSELPADTHMLAASLLNYADDEGYFNANPKLVCAECCPLRDLSVNIQDSLNLLKKIGYIRLGHCNDGRAFGHIVSFAEHQVVNRPNASKIKDMDIVWDNSLNIHAQITDPSMAEGKGREGNKEGNNTLDFFDEFWELYPRQRRGGKDKARQAYLKAIKRATEREILDGVKSYAGSSEVAGGFAKGAAAWLNDDRWANEYRPPSGGNGYNGGGSGSQGKVGGTIGAAQSLLDRWREEDNGGGT